MKTTCLRVLLALLMCAAGAAAVSMGQMRHNWHDVFEGHIRSEAAHENIMLSNVTIEVDTTRRSVALAGTVATPTDVRKLHEIIESSGMTVSDERRLTPVCFPTNWPVLVCAPAQSLIGKDAALAARAISNYVGLVRSYDTQVRSLAVNDITFTRTWRALFHAESKFLNSATYVVKNRPASAKGPVAQPVSTNTLYQDAAELMRQYKAPPQPPRR